MKEQITPKKKNFFKSRGFLQVIIVFALAIITIVSFAIYKKKEKKSSKEIIRTIEKTPQIEYGIIVDSLKVYKGNIEENQNLSEILVKYGVRYAVIDKIARNYKNIFDVRKIKAGNNFTVICNENNNDSIKKTLYFIYDISPKKYIIYDLRDSINVSIGEYPVDVDIKTAGGFISSSLWSSMYESGFNPELALLLSDIYAWTIDFYGIQKNDQYKILYEELSVNGKNIGVGKILGAHFKHIDKDFYTIFFQQDSTNNYFNEKGESMHRAFLKAPLKFNRISSRFSHSRMHPILKYRRPHLGVDYAAPKGTPVRAIGDGIVTKAGYSSGAGNIIKIKHNGTYSTAYMHLWKFKKEIKVGVRVSQGEIIGYVGSTGLSTGPHLDFRFYKNGAAIDPLKVESPPVKPIDSINLKDFLFVKDSILNILEQIEITNNAKREGYMEEQ